MPRPLGLLQQDAPNVLEEECTALMQERHLWAEEAIKIAQEKQVRAHNSCHQPITYKEGDLVLLDPHRLNLIDIQGMGRKLMQCRIGPFEILEKINDNAYQLRLPDTYPMQNVVNMSHL